MFNQPLLVGIKVLFFKKQNKKKKTSYNIAVNTLKQNFVYMLEFIFKLDFWQRKCWVTEYEHLKLNYPPKSLPKWLCR